MAKPSIFQHPKFLRLVHILRMPTAHVLGHLEMMWHSGFGRGDAFLGDEVGVELSAGWAGEPGELCRALLSCGFLDQDEAGRHQIHDLMEHAPDYVRARMRMRKQRAKDKGDEASTHKQSTHELRNSCVTVPNSSELLRTPYQTKPNQTKPDQTNKNPPTPRKRGNSGGQIIAAGFVEFWDAFPRKVKKPATIKAWNKLAPDESLRAVIMAALERQKQSAQWRKDNGTFAPHPTTWLNGRRWEDEIPDSPDLLDGLRSFVEGEIKDPFSQDNLTSEMKDWASRGGRLE